MTNHDNTQPFVTGAAVVEQTIDREIPTQTLARRRYKRSTIKDQDAVAATPGHRAPATIPTSAGTETGWVTFLARLDPSTPSSGVETDCRELVERVRPTLPDAVDIELISPTTNDADQAGFVISSPDPALLSSWIESHAAAEAIRLLGRASHTPVAIIAQGARTPTGFPVSYVVSYNVPPENSAHFQQWLPKMVAAHQATDGFVSAEYHAPYTATQQNWTIVIRFATNDDLSRWLNSPRRNQLVDELSTIATDVEIHRAGLSWAGWLPHQPQPVPRRLHRWKQALATLLALYPTVMLTSLHLAPRLGDKGWGWPAWLVTFTTVSLAVATLSWVLMPAVTNILKSWLLPSPGHQPRYQLAQTALVITSLTALLTIFALTS